MKHRPPIGGVSGAGTGAWARSCARALDQVPYQPIGGGIHIAAADRIARSNYPI